MEASVYRATLRQRCLTARATMDPTTHADLSRQIQAQLEAVLRSDLVATNRSSILAFYFPIRNEFDARPLVLQLISSGWRAALPVVLSRDAPMVYRSWLPDSLMKSDVHGIPVPTVDQRVQPTIVLLPLVAFDCEGYRLGYGGGYFDRTLSAQVPPPLTIGIGFELGRCPTIRPQAHDVRLSAIVTEAGVMYYD